MATCPKSDNHDSSSDVLLNKYSRENMSLANESTLNDSGQPQLVFCSIRTQNSALRPPNWGTYCVEMCLLFVSYSFYTYEPD